MLNTIKSIISIINAIVLTIFPGLTLQDIIDAKKSVVNMQLKQQRSLQYLKKCMMIVY